MKALKSVLSWVLAMALTGAALVAVYSYFELPGLIIAIALGLASALRQFRSVLALLLEYEGEREKRRIELQWFEPSDAHRLHFPSMLMMYSALDDYYVRLYALRRTADGTWQRRPTERSHEVEVKEMHAVEDWWDLQKALPEWKTMEDPRIEVAYQRFIHAQDVVIVGDRGDRKTQAEAWFEEEETYVESKAKSGHWAEKWTEYRESLTSEELEKRHA
jgi:hypothetical protein